jgi:hypothetical protein
MDKRLKLFLFFIIGLLTYSLTVSPLYAQTPPFVETAPNSTSLNLPSPTAVNPTTNPIQVIPSIPFSSLRLGGPTLPTDRYYCINHKKFDLCEDPDGNARIPKGLGGTQGKCGTVIEQAHKLTGAFPQELTLLRDRITKNITNCGYSVKTEGDYVSTYFVIDGYNLSGLIGLSKKDPSYVSPTGLIKWWKLSSSGYIYIPYSVSAIQQFVMKQRDLTGCVIFLKTNSGYHVGLINNIEIYTPGGDGIISFLQAGTKAVADRLLITGWNITNASITQAGINSVTGFGCHK